MEIRDSLLLWCLTVVVATLPILIGALILYLQGGDGDPYWDKFDPVVQDGHLLIAATAILAASVASSRSARPGSFSSVVAMILVALSASAWAFAEFTELLDSGRVAEISYVLFLSSTLCGAGLAWRSAAESQLQESNCGKLLQLIEADVNIEGATS